MTASRILRDERTLIVKFTIIGQPVSLKNSYRIIHIGGHGSLARSKEARDYAKDFEKQFPAVARVMFEGPVKVTMHLFYGWEGPDLCEAYLLDLMAPKYQMLDGKAVKQPDGSYAYGPKERVMVRKGTYKNDRQVREKHVYHSIDKANPRAEIEVETLQPQQASLIEDAPSAVKKFKSVNIDVDRDVPF